LINLRWNYEKKILRRKSRIMYSSLLNQNFGCAKANNNHDMTL